MTRLRPGGADKHSRPSPSAPMLLCVVAKVEVGERPVLPEHRRQLPCPLISDAVDVDAKVEVGERPVLPEHRSQLSRPLSCDDVVAKVEVGKRGPSAPVLSKTGLSFSILHAVCEYERVQNH